MPRERFRPARDVSGALRAVTEDRDNLGRLVRRITEFYPPETEPDEMEIGIITRREDEQYIYRVASLDVGDGLPPQYQVDLRTDIYLPVGGTLRLALRLEETRVETMTLHEAMRREQLRRSPQSIAMPEERGHEFRAWFDVWANRLRRSRLPAAEPLPPRNLIPPHVPPSQGSAASPPPSTEQAATNARVTHWHWGEMRRSGVRMTSADNSMRRYAIEADEARAALTTRSCSLEKGCQGYCVTCKYCQLHCTCPKPEAPKLERRIRME